MYSETPTSDHENPEQSKLVGGRDLLLFLELNVCLVSKFSGQVQRKLDFKFWLFSCKLVVYNVDFCISAWEGRGDLR